MQCPTDGSTLVMSERSGVEIDYCPTCRGVWLDRGELDKILDRAANESAGRSPSAPPVAPFGTGAYDPRTAPSSYDTRGYEGRRDDRNRSDRDGYGREGYGRDGYGDGRGRKKRESWLSDLFD